MEVEEKVRVGEEDEYSESKLCRYHWEWNFTILSRTEIEFN